MKIDEPVKTASSTAELGPRLTALFAAAVGIVVLALYASQPLVEIIGSEFGLSPSMSGLTTTLTLLGYAAGLFFLVPLTDLFDNRRLIRVTLVGDSIALSTLALAPRADVFLIASFMVGLLTSAIQMLVPVAASLSSEALRGRTIGNVMSGLMLGILLSRPIASAISQILGWRYLYGLLGFSVAGLAIFIPRFIPTHRPVGSTRYSVLMKSLGSILNEEPILKFRAASQAMCMGAFGVFWTAVALRLTRAPFSLGQGGIALFSLAGAAGAIVAPVAGRAGDRGLTREATALAHTAIMVAMVLAFIGGMSILQSSDLSLVALVSAAVVLDLGVIADQTLGRRAINLLRQEARGRINGLFTGLFFLGAAAGSAMSGIAWTFGGWGGVCATGLVFGVGAIGVSLIGSSNYIR